jgi:hypothetical protein
MAPEAVEMPKQIDEHGNRRIPLTAKQRQFFERQRSAIQQIDAAMKGALQLIVEEHELRGKVTLSDDFAVLIVTEQE